MAENQSIGLIIKIENRNRKTKIKIESSRCRGSVPENRSFVVRRPRSIVGVVMVVVGRSIFGRPVAHFEALFELLGAKGQLKVSTNEI